MYNALCLSYFQEHNINETKTNTVDVDTIVIIPTFERR